MDRIAQVYVDVGLPHLDRPFDYTVPEALADRVQPGVRVKVRFAGRRADGWVVGLTDGSERDRLAPLLTVVSAEPVLPPASVRLIRAVADHCGGTFGDVARLAVPPRHAASETAAPPPAADPARAEWANSPLDLYPRGADLLAALAQGGQPRAAWSLVPVADRAGDWADGLAAAAAATVASGRSAVLVVPEATACDELAAALARRVDPTGVARQTADLGPAARYRGFLRAVRGQARVVLGTRAAAYTPLADVGLVALWDDGDDLYDDPRAPYPHTRDVLALRAAQQGTAVLFAAYARSTDLQAWVEAGWLTALELPAPQRRRHAPRRQIASQDDRATERDPAADRARLPHDVFTVVRDGLTSGPVLVQVPRLGYRRGLVCTGCGAAVRCSDCAGPLEAEAGPPATLTCTWCGRSGGGWRCPACRTPRYRAAIVGHRQTARELERAFAGTPVRHSDGDQPLVRVPAEPALIVATPGAEPHAATGYAAAVLLDAAVTLSRPSLRAGEEALRRWWAATALVRSGAAGGTVLLVGPATDRAVQAWLRLDPAGFAERELADRRAAGFPPATRLAVVQGEPAALDEVRRVVTERRLDWLDCLGPVPVADDVSRLLLRGPAARGRDLAALVQELAAARSAAKATGAVHWRLDPADLG